MKKKFGLPVMIICLLALSLTFAGCDMDANGGGNDFEGTWRGEYWFHYAIVITGRNVSVHRLANATAAITEGNRQGSGRITRFGTAGEAPIADLGEGLTGILRLGSFGLEVSNLNYGGSAATTISSALFNRR